jgi:hypothetical protein
MMNMKMKMKKKWEVRIDGATDSFWEYKHDAIEQIIEILDTQGDEAGLEGYIDVEQDEDFELTTGEIVDMLFDLDEMDFYDKLDELKEFVGYDNDIRLINLDDDDELDFLE